ncbi:MAG: GntR family transcriptional regulator [Moritella sp.]|uniref:GntR family transcriptional regulator n=1 Tax=Moritella sp. TaxID=78556 RepID=UPI001DB8EA90|nr:GntR family transcriptional regulator [Moritella sp.]NQZ49917.1 GntR family transcriptional regulator [Moritella sp.]
MTKKTISEQRIAELANFLQDKIHSGEIDTCEFLRQNELEKMLDANRFTIRQVLTELTNRNVLEHIPYRGHKVRVHSADEREQITETRLLLEQGAAGQVMMQIDEAGLVQLHERAVIFAKAVESGDLQAQIRANYAFHSFYYSYCHNVFLCDLINELREKGIRVSRNAWRSPHVSAQSRDEHFAMVEALKNKDLLGLQHLIYQHLNAWKKDTITVL